MKPEVLLREAAATARASLVSSVLILLVIAGIDVAALATVGRQAAAENELALLLDGPSARTLTVTVTSDAQVITPAAVQSLASLSHTDAVVATSLPVDAYSASLGRGTDPVAIVDAYGTLSRAITITRGRLPATSEVILAEDLMTPLGLAEPVGSLVAPDGREWAIVGTFTASPPFEDFGRMAISSPALNASSGTRGFTFGELRVVADSRNSVGAVQDVVLASIPADQQDTRVTTALAAAQTGTQAQDALAGLGRSVLLLILGAGAFLVVAVVLADVLVRRRDLGRRRTLGITRGDLIALVALRSVIPAGVGAVIGAVVGCVYVRAMSGQVPVAMAIAVTVLAVVTTLLASLPPAVFASRVDPVEVMRTP